jgi:hypothetical protein
MKLTTHKWAKLTRSLLCAALISGTFFTACQKESISSDNPSETLTPTQTTQSEDASLNITAAQNVVMNTFKIFAQKAGEAGELTTSPLLNVETRNQKCTKVTSSGWQRSVNNITLDFGDGCMDVDGRMMSGQLHGRIQKSKRTGEITDIILSPCNFMVDCSITTGEMVLSNVCKDAKGQYHFDWAVNNVRLASIDMKTKEELGYCLIQSRGKALQTVNGSAHKNLSSAKNEHEEDDHYGDSKNGKNNGKNSFYDNGKSNSTNFADAIFDFDKDVYLFDIISGKVVDAKHGTFTVKTKAGNPLQVEINCKYPNKGIVEVNPKSAWILPNFSIDLGNGNCDSEALIKVGGLLKHTIKLP